MPPFCAPALFGLTIQVVGISEAIRRREQTHTEALTKEKHRPSSADNNSNDEGVSDIHMSPRSAGSDGESAPGPLLFTELYWSASSNKSLLLCVRRLKASTQRIGSFGTNAAEVAKDAQPSS